MQRYGNILQDTSGNVITTATVNVYLANTTTAATIYSDNGTTTKDNPFLTDTDGTYEFWAANGVYDIVFSKTGYTFTDADTADIQVFDPAEDVNTTSAANTGSGEDNLMTYTLPANSLFLNDHVVRIHAWGTTAANGNNKTIKLKFGTATLVSSGVLTVSNKDWEIRGLVVRTAAATQEATATFFEATPSTVGPDRTTPAETLSSAVIIKCTGEAVDDNDIVQRGMLVEVLNASG